MWKPRFSGHLTTRLFVQTATPRILLAALCAVALSVVLWGAREAYAFFTSLQRTTGTITMTPIVPRGSITIAKNTVPNNPRDFAFTGGLGAFSLDDDSNSTLPNQRDFTDLAPGSYFVGELLDFGDWQLTAISCNDSDGGTTTDVPGRSATIDLDAGQHLTCTFTNSRGGTITIAKNALPDDAQDFSFRGDLGRFDLDNDTDPVLENMIVFEKRAGSYSVREQVTNGWNLTDIACDDPDGGTAADRLFRRAMIDLDLGEKITCVFTNYRLDQLAERLTPIFVLDFDERFLPLDLEHYVAEVDLWKRFVERTSRCFVVRRCIDVSTTSKPAQPETLSLGDLPSGPLRCPAPTLRYCYYFLDIPGLEPSVSTASDYQARQSQLFEKGAKPTVYWRVQQDNSGSAVAVQYWLLYLYNDLTETTDTVGNRHESDWEQITILVDRNLNPVQVGYSQHGEGERRLWQDLVADGETIDDHPLVYVARGSHANYFGGGDHAIAWWCAIVPQCNDDVDGQGLVVSREFVGCLEAVPPQMRYDLLPITWPAFGDGDGDYGSGNHIIGVPPRFDSLLVDRAFDPQSKQRREEWRAPTTWVNMLPNTDEDGPGLPCP